MKLSCFLLLLIVNVGVGADQLRGLRNSAHYDNRKHIERSHICDKEWDSFLDCIKYNIFDCLGCNLKSPGLASEDECDGFEAWYSENVECCEHDECGRTLADFSTCMSCIDSTVLEGSLALEASVSDSPSSVPSNPPPTGFPTLSPSSSLAPSRESDAPSQSPTTISAFASSEMEGTVNPTVFPTAAPTPVLVPTRRIPLWLP